MTNNPAHPEPPEDPPESPDDDAPLVEPPASLVRDLNDLYGPAAHPTVPRNIDAAMHQRARRHMGDVADRQVRRRLLIGGSIAGVAAAAVITLVALLGSPVAPPPGSSPGDVNGDGVVDILDAFGLARRLENPDITPADLPALWDLNGDGRIDRQDVDAIARRAVRLEGGPTS